MWILATQKTTGRFKLDLHVKNYRETDLSSACRVLGAVQPIPIHQLAYRWAHSTETIESHLDALIAVNCGEVTQVGQLDLSTAFDMVNHDI